MGKIFLAGLVGAVLAGGCTRAHYQNVSASLRNAGGDPVRKNYFGLNFNFAVDQPPSYHRPEPDAAAPTARAE